ncbi:MAG: class I SAM-dependent methyltransferase [Chitinophagales bacterium]|nr:class I SAM-dependent methyltransferase [Chitinophagales bacterium]
MHKWHRLKSFLQYLVKGQSRYLIHSPFVFDFINEVLNDERQFYAYEAIASIEQQYRNNQQSILLSDLGSLSQNGKTDTVSHLFHKTALPSKHARLLFKMINYYQPQNLLEIGTGLGFSTLHLALAKKKAPFVSLEGNPMLADLALKNLHEADAHQVQILRGNFKETLPFALEKLEKLDFVFIDGNHTKEATLDYFAQCVPLTNTSTIMVFDDIYWSPGMTEAWKQITTHSQVTLAIDLWRLGIVFFRKEIKQRDVYTLYF